MRNRKRGKNGTGQIKQISRSMRHLLQKGCGQTDRQRSSACERTAGGAGDAGNGAGRNTGVGKKGICRAEAGGAGILQASGGDLYGEGCSCREDHIRPGEISGAGYLCRTA